MQTELTDPLLASLTAMVTTGRPKDKLAKRACQVIEAHLPSLTSEGLLCHTLVTVLPDPTRTILAAWRALEGERRIVADLLCHLPGMYFALLATEVHAGTRPKRKATQEATTELATEEPEDQMDVQDDTVPSAAPQASTRLKGLQGQPHLHLLVYYPKVSDPPLDLSHLKRVLLERFPKADVNQVMQKTPKAALGKDSARSSIVKAMSYVLKGVDCQLRQRVLDLVLPGRTTGSMNPMLLRGEMLELGSPVGTRLIAMMRALTLPIDVPFSLAGAAAPAHHDMPLHPSRETLALNTLALRVKELNLRYKDGLWYRREKDTQHTWVLAYSSKELLERLSDDPVVLDICVRYASKINGWFDLAPFPKIRDLDRFRYLELTDAVYDIRTGDYCEKTDFSFTCFRFYRISVFKSITTPPVEWLRLIDTAYSTDPIEANKEDFIKKMAGLLRQRRPKERILFLVGASNSGKSTVIKWITSLYPAGAIATVNDSIAPLSSVKGREILVCDEFSTHKISRTNLLLLTDGTTGLTVRSMGKDAEFLTDVLLPQVYTCNQGHEPRYKNDPQPEAVNNRFQFFEWKYPLRNPDLDKAALIIEETPYIVFYLNRLLRN